MFSKQLLDSFKLLPITKTFCQVHVHTTPLVNGNHHTFHHQCLQYVMSMDGNGIAHIHCMRQLQ